MCPAKRIQHSVTVAERVHQTVYFHVCNMVPVSDLEDVLQTMKVENVQLSSDGFSHLPDLS